jgi:hypothetical protein
MNAFVVDVNVAISANQKTPRANSACQLACIRKLREVKKGTTVLDGGDYILKEYRRHLNMRGQPGAGDEFMYWIFQNQYNLEVCARVTVNPDPERGFKEFPDDPRLLDFDRGDRIYAAVALASRMNPTILNALDSDWAIFQKPLKEMGVTVTQLCPDCLKTVEPNRP